MSDEEIKKLTRLYKQAKDKKTATRVDCVILWAKGYDWLTIEDVLMVSAGSIRNAVEKYKLFGTNSLTFNHYEGHNYKMTGEQEKATVEFVEDNYIANSKMVINWVKEQFGIEYTEQGMQEFLKRKGFVYKKPKKVPGKQPSKEDEAIYFSDGSGFDHNVKAGYGWIKKGQEKILKTNTSRQKINVNGAYNPKGQEAICIEQEEPVNQQSNIKLVDKIINMHPEYKKISIVLDNAKYNYGNLFGQHLERLKKEKEVEIELIYLPTYSPNLNLIERLWKYAKKKLLSVYYETFEEFKDKIKRFFEHDVKERTHRLNLKRFIGTAFQIISS
ncbi:MAG: IS630 family transposase [Dissulfuribacterales bacterium]